VADVIMKLRIPAEVEESTPTTHAPVQNSPKYKKKALLPPPRPVCSSSPSVEPTLAVTVKARARKQASALLKKWGAIPVTPASFHDIAAYDPLVHWGGICKADPSMLPAALIAMSFLQIKASAAGTERIFSAASLIQSAVRNRLHPDMLELLVL
jgi:hypothetical protein